MKPDWTPVKHRWTNVRTIVDIVYLLSSCFICIAWYRLNVRRQIFTQLRRSSESVSFSRSTVLFASGGAVCLWIVRDISFEIFHSRHSSSPGSEDPSLSFGEEKKFFSEEMWKLLSHIDIGYIYRRLVIKSSSDDILRVFAIFSRNLLMYNQTLNKTSNPSRKVSQTNFKYYLRRTLNFLTR